MDNVPTVPRVLFAEDDVVTRELFRTFFERVGWSYEVAPDGDKALETFRKRNFDVVITDYCMPNLGGLELLRGIQQHKPGQPVIIVSGKGDVEDLVNLLNEGASDYIQKPVDFDSLERCVTRVLWSESQKGSEYAVYKYAASERSIFHFTSAEFAEIRVPLIIVDRLFHGGKIDLHTKLKLELAFQEALTNSFEHGNLDLNSEWKEQFDAKGLDRYSLIKRERLADPLYANRIISIEVEYLPHLLRMTIVDSGKGFEEKTALVKEQQKLASHGRGLAIIKTVMDEVHFDCGGSKIVMVKRLAN